MAKKSNKSETNANTEESKLKGKTEHILALQDEVAKLQSRNEELAAKIDNSVPKEKLASETPIEKIQWLYNDLNGMQRVIAHLLTLVIIGGVIVGVYFAVNKMAGQAEASQYVSMIISIILAYLGIDIQTKALKLPSEKTSVQ